TTSSTTTTSTTTSTSTITTTDNCFDNAECSSYNLTPQDCASQFTQKSCPKSCSSQCLKPADCSALNCVYGSAQVDKDGSCVCVCNDKYFGPNCDKLNITAVSSSSDPNECNFLACSDEDVVALCPITCKVCGGATFCRNDGTVDYATCQCNCLPNFSGDNRSPYTILLVLLFQLACVLTASKEHVFPCYQWPCFGDWVGTTTLLSFFPTKSFKTAYDQKS
ncbi:hypothetical protein BpHYR1_013611, partial [Brachionus plicatilis]